MNQTITTSIAPMLSVRRGIEAVEFYKTAFGAVETYRHEEGGEVVSKLSVSGAEFWVADEAPDFGNYSPETLNGATVRMILTVADPFSIFAQAIAAGAKEVFPIGEGHGWRLGRLVDPYGHHWEIGHPL